MEDVQDTVITDESQEAEIIQETEITQEEVTEPTQEKTEPNPEESKVPKGVQKKINKLTAKNYALQEELKQERLKNQDLSKEPTVPDPYSFMDNYGKIDQGKYNQAMNEWYSMRGNWERSRQDTTEREKLTVQEQQANLMNFYADVAELRKTNPDILNLLNQDIFTQPLSNYLYNAEGGAKLALYLGKNPDLAKRIGALGPDQMVDELESIEEQMKVPDRTVSHAASPLTPVDEAKGTNVKNIDDIEDPQEWYNARKAARIAARRRGG